MKQKNKISGVLICVLTVALVLSLYYAAFYNSLSQKVSMLELQHLQNMQQLSTYQSMILKKAQTKADIADLQTKVQQFSQSPVEPESEIAPDIQRGLTEAGVSALNISVDTPSEAAKTNSGKSLMKVAISLKIDCTQDELTALLHYFEKESKIPYTVNTVAYTTDREDTDEKSVTLTMSANYIAQAGTGS
jgi:Tfp pilus assembly protein PilO